MFHNFSFYSQARCSYTRARAGIFMTPHGSIDTPRFMPVGTLANVKTLTPAQLEAAGAQMILANTELKEELARNFDEISLLHVNECLEGIKFH